MVAWVLDWGHALGIAVDGSILGNWLQLARSFERFPAFAAQAREPFRVMLRVFAAFAVVLVAINVVFSFAPLDALVEAVAVLVASAGTTYLVVGAGGALVAHAIRRYAARQGGVPPRDA